MDPLGATSSLAATIAGPRAGARAIPDIYRATRTGAEISGLDQVTTMKFLAFGTLIDSGAALKVGEVDESWAKAICTGIRPGLFDHISTETNRRAP